MKNKKSFKYFSITIMTAGVILIASVTPSYFLNNSGTPTAQVFKDNQQVNNTDYTNQLDYIRSDVAKQDGMINTVKSIEFASDFSSAASTAAIVTKMDGSTLLYTWGYNDSGQLGLGDITDRPTPTLVSFFSSLPPITQIALGESHSAALLENGSLYTWGDNSNGQLGLGDSGSATNRPTPTSVSFFNDKKIVQISLATKNSAAVLDNGELYTWGGNSNGQLGLGDTTDRPTPTPVSFFKDEKIAQFSFGYWNSAAVLDNGELYTWGYNDSGQLGLGDITDRPTPTKVWTFNSLPPITQIVAGNNHCAALLEDGSLYAWGSNSNGQLGLGDITNRPTPTLVSSFSSSPIIQIASAGFRFVALTKNHSLYTWGGNYKGQLGLGDITDRPTPTLVSFFSSLPPITQIALGANHSAALLKDGSLYTWGYNYFGQLGLDDTTDRPTPTWMHNLGKDSHITANDKITTIQAVDSFWVDGAFNQVGFENSFNLINIPDVISQEITMDTEPTWNNSAGTMTMNVRFKYFYDANGLLVADTSTTDMTISGFKPYDKISDSNLVVSAPIFPWWWILVGINGAAIIGALVWLLVKKQKERQLTVKLILQRRNATQAK